ncbi:helix-turn-helix domain-containing protein [Spiroplasma endosymbiont of Tipula paludosa]|uniref:helix-turn-helix domain-containing protein n=1 Tax=Spiroplasma endosymbiont of Tipula paludosa TaxID=3066295 RepID=UPI0035C94170
MGYKHLGIDERIYIENQLKFKVKISEIAKNLNRSISTINREVNKTWYITFNFIYYFDNYFLDEIQMLDKYKDKNEFYSLVGIKCYSYVPSLLYIFATLLTRKETSPVSLLTTLS